MSSDTAPYLPDFICVYELPQRHRVMTSCSTHSNFVCQELGANERTL